MFVQTDNPSGNTILAYDRHNDGTLEQAGVYETDGLGGVLTGSVVDHLASQGSLAYDAKHSVLYALNAGSNTITVFSGSPGMNVDSSGCLFVRMAKLDRSGDRPGAKAVVRPAHDRGRVLIDLAVLLVGGEAIPISTSCATKVTSCRSGSAAARYHQSPYGPCLQPPN